MVFEILHSMALIHDDIIDKSPRRHNVDTVHEFITKKLGKKNRDTANSQAILVGDLVLARVYELLFSWYSIPQQQTNLAQQNVHAMIEEVILGQMIDVQMMTGQKVQKNLIDKKNIYKTASYTFTRPLLTGAILAWADNKTLAHIKELGNNLGLAFQLRDDLKDILATETDKKIFSDIQEGQQTFFTRYIEKNGTPAQKILLKNSMKKQLNKKQIAALQKMFHTSWAIDTGKKHIKTYAAKAFQALKKIPFSKEAKQDIAYLITKIADLSI